MLRVLDVRKQYQWLDGTRPSISGLESAASKIPAALYHPNSVRIA